MGAEERFNCNAGLRVFVFFLVGLFFLSLGLCFFLKGDFRGDPRTKKGALLCFLVLRFAQPNNFVLKGCQLLHLLAFPLLRITSKKSSLAKKNGLASNNFSRFFWGARAGIERAMVFANSELTKKRLWKRPKAR